MNRILAVMKPHIPALLLALYVFSFWVLPQGWNEDNALDGSWRYALGKFRGLGLSLGRDSWFTYGPVAHWFGAPMGVERYQPLPYYVFGLFVAAIMSLSCAKILAATALSFRARVVFVLLFPLCFIGMEGVQEVHLIIALLLLLTSLCLEESPATAGIWSLVLLSACGFLYKISFGMLSLFTLTVLLASLFARRKAGGIRILLYPAGYATVLYTLFAATSGSFDLVTYIHLGLETSDKYSEIMIRNMPYSPPNYMVALVYCASGSVLVWLAAKRMAGRAAGLCLVTVCLGGLLLLFKHGFVRADLAHMKLFYGCVTPLLAVLALVSFRGFTAKAGVEKVLLCSASLLLFVIYGIMLAILPGQTGPLNLPKNWLTCGHRIIAGIRGQNPEEFAAKRAFIRNSHPALFAFLNQHGRTFAALGRKPRITFYPWELMNFEGVEGYELAPSPSLQLYSSGPHSQAHRLEAKFLSSERRPDIVVVGPAAIDDRSPVGELTDLLPTLCSRYRVAAVVEGFTILEAHEPGTTPERVVRYSEVPQGVPGEFLRLSLDQPTVVSPLLWRLAATLFKSPQLSVTVRLMYDNNERTEHVWRGYASQLRGGVVFSPWELPDFLRGTVGTAARQAAPQSRNTPAIRNAVAEVRRSSGFWNLPVFPDSVPLKVHYGTVR